MYIELQKIDNEPQNASMDHILLPRKSKTYIIFIPSINIARELQMLFQKSRSVTIFL
jgi:hypothetical protein